MSQTSIEESPEGEGIRYNIKLSGGYHAIELAGRDNMRNQIEQQEIQIREYQEEIEKMKVDFASWKKGSNLAMKDVRDIRDEKYAAFKHYANCHISMCVGELEKHRAREAEFEKENARHRKVANKANKDSQTWKQKFKQLQRQQPEISGAEQSALSQTSIERPESEAAEKIEQYQEKIKLLEINAAEQIEQYEEKIKLLEISAAEQAEMYQIQAEQVKHYEAEIKYLESAAAMQMEEPQPKVSKPELAAKTEAKNLVQLTKVGIAVRHRFIEHQRHGSDARDDKWIVQGNDAAHSANPIADASLSFCKKPLDAEWFLDFYGVPYQTMLKLQSCQAFVDLVTWYGNVQSWKRTHFGNSEFRRTWLTSYLPSISGLDLTQAKEFFGKSDNKALHAKLKAIYDAEKKKSDERRKGKCLSCGEKGHKVSQCMYY